jgi:hypothetical protein
MWPQERALRSSGPFDARSHAGFAKCSVAHSTGPFLAGIGCCPGGAARVPAAFRDRPGAGRSVRCTGSLFWGSILYSRMALARASTPSVRPVGRTSSCGRLRVGQGEAMHGSRQTRLPVEAIEKTLDVLVLERQRLHEQRSGPEPLEANRRAIVYWQRELAEARRPTSASA